LGVQFGKNSDLEIVSIAHETFNKIVILTKHFLTSNTWGRKGYGNFKNFAFLKTSNIFEIMYKSMPSFHLVTQN
jgi:hypothetical protein